MSNPSLDLYLLITQGQYSLKGRTFLSSGYFIETEEIVKPPIVRRYGAGGGGLITPEKEEYKKLITLKVKGPDGSYFRDTIELDDIDLSVDDVTVQDGFIFVSVKDISAPNSKPSVIVRKITIE